MITFYFSVQKMLWNFGSRDIDVHCDALAFVIDCNKRLDILFSLFLFNKFDKPRSLLDHKKKTLLFNRYHHKM